MLLLPFTTLSVVIDGLYRRTQQTQLVHPSNFISNSLGTLLTGYTPTCSHRPHAHTHKHRRTHTHNLFPLPSPVFFFFSTCRFPIKIKALAFALSPCFSSHVSSAPTDPLPHATFALSVSQSLHTSSPNTYQSLPPSHFCCCITFNYGKLKITSPEHRVTGRLALTALCCNSRQGKGEGKGKGGSWG